MRIPERVGPHPRPSGGAVGIAIAGAVIMSPGPGLAQDGGGDSVCAETATLLFGACRREVAESLLTDRAICINLADDGEREACLSEATATRDEERQLCREQRDARLELCVALGEERYDPPFDPGDFVDDFTDLAVSNQYFPLQIGNRWNYIGGDETIRVKVLDETKLIEDVTCVVVNDFVSEDGDRVEDTDDWYAQAVNGDVWYCGELSRNFETFEGDDPEDAELIDIEGSFKAGRDGDQPGIIFLASPAVGDIYRQEFSLGNAEDVAEVLSVDYSFGSDPALDEFVPQDLAELLCAGDCVVTGEFTPVEPGVFERKYYAPGIGLFLEVDPESGDIVQLVDCNFDARCADLPGPVAADDD